MEILKFFEGLRCPLLDKLMQGITYLGEETVFMVVALILFWCVDKWKGYFVLAVGFLGTLLNQFLKLVFRVPRPWIKDPNFTIVESARGGATGYSFPSGHTQNAVGTFGGIARSTKRGWLRIVCIVLAALIGLSRMYLGVHYPMDVGVAILIGVALIFLLYPILKKAEHSPKVMYSFLAVMTLLAIAYIAFVKFGTFPSEVHTVEEGAKLSNYASGLKNGYTLFGALLGLIVGYTVDLKKLHFEEKAPIPGQILKAVLGLAGIMAIRLGLDWLFKSELLPIFKGQLWWCAARYFLMVVFAGAIWPMTFPLWQKVGARKAAKK